MSKKRIYLVRHGETNYNVGGLVQDGSSVLTERGVRQANQVAERLRHLDFQNLIVSDYERTKQTAEPVAELTGITPEFTDLFREVRRPSEFFHTKRNLPGYQDFLLAVEANFTNPDWRHSDEESVADIITRAKKALQHLTNLEGDTVVISHGVFICLLTATVACNLELDAPTWQKMHKGFYVTNTGISTFVYDEEKQHWYILTFNDHVHFAE